MSVGNPENLRRAAQAKRAAAVKRAEAGLRHVIKNGEPVTFEAVAAAGKVSKDFLYRTPDLRERITALRQASAGSLKAQPATDDVVPRDTSSIIRTLTTKLTQERADHRAEVTELKNALSAAHGRILELSRQVDVTVDRS